MYDTYEYANGRLAGTIVSLINGPAIHVHHVHAKMIVEYNLLTDDFSNTRKVPLDKVNLEPVPLGFFNSPKGAVYLSRQPKRNDWRQGLRDNTINARPRRSTRASYIEINEAIEGVTMKPKEAIRLSMGKGIMIAFHRYWAVDRGRLWHKWTQVGVIDENGFPSFTEKYRYLESRYAEDITNV